jgi:hypothetical protein
MTELGAGISLEKKILMEVSMTGYRGVCINREISLREEYKPTLVAGRGRQRENATKKKKQKRINLNAS